MERTKCCRRTGNKKSRRVAGSVVPPKAVDHLKKQ